MRDARPGDARPCGRRPAGRAGKRHCPTPPQGTASHQDHSTPARRPSPGTATPFPTTTLLINLSGSLAIGLLVPLVDNFAHGGASLRGASLLRPFLIVGLLGGWTTYSTLAVDAVVLAKDGHAAAGVLSLVATLVGGLVLVVCGNTLGRRALGRRVGH